MPREPEGTTAHETARDRVPCVECSLTVEMQLTPREGRCRLRGFFEADAQTVRGAPERVVETASAAVRSS